MSSSKSQRELLFARVHKQRMAESLSRNLSQLTKTEDRLSSSRLSSASSSSLRSLRRAYSTASHNPNKSSSKEKMLKEIIEKLRLAKVGKQIRTEQKIGEQDRQGDSIGRDSRRSRVNKLEEMMKDIKKCNQMSTKAVYSIKKDINEQLTIAVHKTEEPQKSTSILVLINELAAIKQELTGIKKENKQLLAIIQQQKVRQCPHCNCLLEK